MNNEKVPYSGGGSNYEEGRRDWLRQKEMMIAKINMLREETEKRGDTELVAKCDLAIKSIDAESPEEYSEKVGAVMRHIISMDVRSWKEADDDLADQFVKNWEIKRES